MTGAFRHRAECRIPATLDLGCRGCSLGDQGPKTHSQRFFCGFRVCVFPVPQVVWHFFLTVFGGLGAKYILIIIVIIIYCIYKSPQITKQNQQKPTTQNHQKTKTKPNKNLRNPKPKHLRPKQNPKLKPTTYKKHHETPHL